MKTDNELSAEDLKELVAKYKEVRPPPPSSANHPYFFITIFVTYAN